MRYSYDHKEKTHKRIVETASRAFREKGFDGVGIASLMSTLSLTHGGFYAHFEDKESLVGEASLYALEESLVYIKGLLEQGGLTLLIEFYLGELHRNTPAMACPLTSISAELSRHPIDTRTEYTKKLRELFTTIVNYMPGDSEDQKERKSHILMSTMAGSVILARSVSDRSLGDQILRSTREHLFQLVSHP